MTPGAGSSSPHLVTVSGQDGPGIAERLFATLAARGIAVDDVEQVRVHGRLLLCVETALAPGEVEGARAALTQQLGDAGVEVMLEPLVEQEVDPGTDRHLVTLLAPEVDAATLEGVAGRIARCGGNIERIVRLSSYPVHSYELSVAGADLDRLRRALAGEAARRQVDLAVQAAGLHRRARHLIVVDADSTLLQGEVIDLLAERSGCGPQVAAVTAAAMAGDIDFADALRRRVRLLAGLKQADLEAVRDGIVLAPGARTLVRTLKRLGYELAVVSGGFTQVIEPVVRDLGIEYLAANVLVLDGGIVTGELDGPIVDRAGKAAALTRFAAAAGVPLSRTIAVGDGANDIDMLAAAGLGIAFNAKPVVRRAADTALSVPYLDAILFLLGISRREVELADRLAQEDGAVTVLAQGEQGTLADNRGARPLLRGWLHVGAFCAWLVGGPFLIAAGPNAASVAALSVYVAGMLAMFGTSAAFHRLRWSAPAWRRMRRADHSAIFVGIAGTTTAVAVLALTGWAQVLVLALVWGGAAAGITLRQMWLDAPQWVVAIPYVVVGWCPIVVAPQLVRGLGWVGFWLTITAGLAYTAGAIVYARKRPDPWPRVFGFHEVFHACTLVGAALLAYVVAFIALPRY